MTKSEIIKIIEALKGQISILEKEVGKAEDKDEKKYPAEGTRVYFVTAYGGINDHAWGYWPNVETEKRIKSMFDSGERFLTKEAAEECAEVKQIECELYALADAAEKWSGETDHYSLQYAFDSDKIFYEVWTSNKMNIPYFKSKDSAMAAVEKVGKERVIKWLTYQRKRPEV